MNGKIEIDELITRAAAARAINEAFELMHEGEAIRTVIRF